MLESQKGTWWELRHWGAAAAEYPTLSARCWWHRRDHTTRFVVVCESEVYWSCPCLHPVEWAFRSRVEEMDAVSKYVRKAVQQVEGKREAMGVVGQEWAVAHEAIHEYMTLEELPEGGARTTSMMCVFFECGVWKLALQDRHQGLSLWVAAQSLPEAIEALEARLRAGDGDWRPMRAQGGSKGKKR